MDPDWNKWIEYRQKMNTCPSCKSWKHAEVRNYDAMWGDGDVYCKKCDVKIRDWDRD